MYENNDSSIFSGDNSGGGSAVGSGGGPGSGGGNHGNSSMDMNQKNSVALMGGSLPNGISS